MPADWRAGASPAVFAFCEQAAATFGETGSADVLLVAGAAGCGSELVLAARDALNGQRGLPACAELLGVAAAARLLRRSTGGQFTWLTGAPHDLQQSVSDIAYARSRDARSDVALLASRGAAGRERLDWLADAPAAQTPAPMVAR